MFKKTRKCYACGKVKNITKFYKDISKSILYSHRCKICDSRQKLDRKKKYLSGWTKLFPKKMQCQICKRRIEFNGDGKYQSVRFDHKSNKAAPHIKKPYDWLSSRPRNKKNESLWRSFNFGLLCNRCNPFLPTKNREQFVINIYKYVFGRSPK